MKLGARDVRSLLEQSQPPFAAYLLHGPDRGLARERSQQIGLKFTDNLDDPFAVEYISGSQAKSDTACLADALSALPAFGGQRLVIASGTGSELLAAVKNAADYLHESAKLIILAEDVNTRHALVKFCDADKQIASIACYPDEDRDIASLARDIFSRDQIHISSDALQLLINKLGSDRASSRSEIEKLALMAGPSGELTEIDIDMALGDSAAQAIDQLVLSMADGDLQPLQMHFARARREDIQPIAILRQAQTHFKSLSSAKTVMASGQNLQSALSSLRPPPHFKVKPRLTSQLQRLSLAYIVDSLDRLVQIEKDIKSGGKLDGFTLLGQTMLGICLRSRAQK